MSVVQATVPTALNTRPQLFTEAGVFGPDDVGQLEAFYLRYGFATVRGLLGEAAMAQLTRECTDAQRGVLAGKLDERHGSTVFLDEAAKAEQFVNYVEYVNEVSPAVAAAASHPALAAIMRRLLGPDCWLNDNHRFGVVYQDARPGRESGYTRIGWHSDWQAAPNLDIWPSTAFTFHVDATSPANGFLRVVPGSHLWATPAPFRNINNVPVPEGSAETGGYTATTPPQEMPLGFDKIPGEIGVYAEAGDLLLHDCYLWHSAARATADDTVRRHIRGGYYVGDKEGDGAREVFVKNAAR